MDNFDPPSKGGKRKLFNVILAAALMVFWTSRKKGSYEGAKYSHHHLTFFCMLQLRVKIKCNRKSLNCIIFDKRSVGAADLVVRKETMLKSSFLPLPAHGCDGLGPFRDPTLDKSMFFYFPFYSNKQIVVCHSSRHLESTIQDSPRLFFLFIHRPFNSPRNSS